MRKLPPTPKLGRSIDRVDARVELVIACEGEVTEPDYIKRCVQHYGAGMVRLRVIEKHGAPLQVVTAAIQEREKLLQKYRKMTGMRSPETCFKVWALFDKDDYDVEPAFVLAKTNKIQVAFSNPCFELWPLLHLTDFGGQEDSQGLQRLLTGMMPTYHHATNPRVDFDQISELFPDALNRSRRLNGYWTDRDEELGRPSTTVGDLVLKIKQNGKYAERKQAAGQRA